MNINQTQLNLPNSYFQSDDVIFIAQDLLGKKIITNFKGELTSGIIVETEAYCSRNDKASHAYRGKRTQKNNAMYALGGTLYIYICYGVHSLLNIVTNKTNIPDAVLIRAIEPCDGIEIMKSRTNKTSLSNLTNGPGKLSKALGININYNQTPLKKNIIWIQKNYNINKKDIQKRPRIGIQYAGEDANLLWRFYIKDNPYISKK